MAEKEATVYIIDVGSTMARTRNGRQESDLDWAMRYLWDKLTYVVGLNRKTLCVGVLGLGTEETNNKLNGDDGYENISVLHELGVITTASLKSLESAIKPSGSWAGDAVSAIVVAVDMIDTFTKKLKWARKIVLITDAEGALDADSSDMQDIAKKMNDSKISLDIL